MAKPNKIEDALFQQVQSAKSQHAIRVDDNATRYQDSWLYYRGIKPFNITPLTLAQKEGREPIVQEYVENILRDAVDAITPQMLDTFTENDKQAVIFRDNSFQPTPGLDKVISLEVNKVFLNKNDGYRILENALKEALISGNAFTKVFVDEKITNDKLNLPDWVDLEMVMQELQGSKFQPILPDGIANGELSGSDKGVEWIVQDGMSQDGQPIQTVMVRGTLRIYKSDKKLVIENVGLKDLIIDTTCGDDFDKCRYICHKRDITMGEALGMGYKREVLDESSTLSELNDSTYSKWNLVTGEQISQNDTADDDDGDPLERHIRLEEHYIYSSHPSKGKESKLYQVITTEHQVLDWREIPFMPFVNGMIDIIPDSFWGGSIYDVARPYQDALSTVMRIAQRNMIDATYQKTVVVENMYDEESLINSHRVGAVLVEKAGGVGTIRPYPVNELTSGWQASQQALTVSMDRSLRGKVGSVLNEDGSPNNVAASTMAMAIAQEGLKGKVTAKTFARTYIKPIFEKIYDTIRMEGYQIIIPNVPEPITSDMFPEVFEWEVDINTSRDELAENQQLAAVTQMLTQIQSGASLVSPGSMWKVSDKLLSQVGLRVGDYFNNPADQQPDPEQMEAMAFQKEAAKVELQDKIAKVSKTVAETNKIEAETEDSIRDKHVKREIDLNDSSAKIKEIFDKGEEAKAKIMLDNKATDAEIAHDEADITIKHVQTHQKKYNGVRV